jgi:hypothetical protein
MLVKVEKKLNISFTLGPFLADFVKIIFPEILFLYKKSFNILYDSLEIEYSSITSDRIRFELFLISKINSD